MKNPYISQALTLKNEVGKFLPNGLETTADMLLEFMSNSYDEHLRASFCRINDQSYYIDNYNKKTLWDFADSLREYDLIDAIYITSGSDYVFYCDKDGLRFDIGNNLDYPHTKRKAIIPWLVFRIENWI